MAIKKKVVKNSSRKVEKRISSEKEPKKDTGFKGSSKLMWYQAMELLSDRIFKIRTPDGHGTGFHIGNFGHNNHLCAVATALHVVANEEEWDGPMRLVHIKSGTVTLLKNEKESERIIFIYPESDLAIIVFPLPDDLHIRNDGIELLSATQSLKQGVEVGWCGFPGISTSKGNLCFFHGYVSCYLRDDKAYLVDGVAVGGVSGGPAFYVNTSTNRVVVAGVITAYVHNRSTDNSLGLSMIASVSPYERTIKKLQSFAEVSQEAEKQKEERKDTVDDDIPENSGELPVV